MMTVFSNFFRRLFRKPAALPLSLASISLLTEASEAMLTCEQVFELIDQYAERAARGEDVAHLMPLVAAHLDMCPDCREHYEALERVLAGGTNHD
jgi:hypothetical protein